MSGIYRAMDTQRRDESYLRRTMIALVDDNCFVSVQSSVALAGR
jgi:hypothetical protein